MIILYVEKFIYYSFLCFQLSKGCLKQFCFQYEGIKAIQSTFFLASSIICPVKRAFARSSTAIMTQGCHFQMGSLYQDFELEMQCKLFQHNH